jgi:HD-like signal output (HDOD) protein
MDGAQVLAYVKEHAPMTVRLVLSGHAEQHLAMKCIGIAHQYLAKPCDAATLKNIISRATEPGFVSRNEQVITLVGQLENLPSVPAMYSRIVRLLNDPDSTMDDIGAVIASDMAMTAKILQIVNSSFFGISRRVTKPTEAASYLGVDTLKALVLATNVFGQFEATMPNGFSAAKASEHSQNVGAAARAIAQAEHASRGVVDEALVAGLLHDVGELVLASSLPEKFERVVAEAGSDPLAAERAVFGATHSEVGGYLLGLWGLPAPVVEAISLHHEPSESVIGQFSALTAVHVADCLVADRSSSTVDMDYLTRLGLADRLPVWTDAVHELFCSSAN